MGTEVADLWRDDHECIQLLPWLSLGAVRYVCRRSNWCLPALDPHRARSFRCSVSVVVGVPVDARFWASA